MIRICAFTLLYAMFAHAVSSQTLSVKTAMLDDLYRSAGEQYVADIPTVTTWRAPLVGSAPFYVWIGQLAATPFPLTEQQWQTLYADFERAAAARELTEKGQAIRLVLHRLSITRKSRSGEERLALLRAITLRKDWHRFFRSPVWVSGVFQRLEKVSSRSKKNYAKWWQKMARLPVENPVENPVGNCVEKATQYEVQSSLERGISPYRILGTLFRNREYIEQHLSPSCLVTHLFALAGYLHKEGSRDDLYRYFTREECYRLWLMRNADEYAAWEQWKKTASGQKVFRFMAQNTWEHYCAAKERKDRSLHRVILNRQEWLVVLSLLGVLPKVQPIDEQRKAATEQLAEVWRDYHWLAQQSVLQAVVYRVPNTGQEWVKWWCNGKALTLPLPEERKGFYRVEAVRALMHANLQTILRH